MLVAPVIYQLPFTTDQNVIQQSELLQVKYSDAVVIEEQASATTMNRPKLEALLKKLTAGDSIIVYDMS